VDSEQWTERRGLGAGDWVLEGRFRVSGVRGWGSGLGAREESIKNAKLEETKPTGPLESARGFRAIEQ
jgi:hypothetical protein